MEDKQSKTYYDKMKKQKKKKTQWNGNEKLIIKNVATRREWNTDSKAMERSRKKAPMYIEAFIISNIYIYITYGKFSLLLMCVSVFSLTLHIVNGTIIIIQ